MTEYHLLKQLSPETADRYIIATWDSSTRSFKTLFFDDNEDRARAYAHRLEHGDGD